MHGPVCIFRASLNTFLAHEAWAADPAAVLAAAPFAAAARSLAARGWEVRGLFGCLRHSHHLHAKCDWH